MRTPSLHHHPCTTCGARVPCDGALARNDDGWPLVICDLYHRPDGETAWLRCARCADEGPHDGTHVFD